MVPPKKMDTNEMARGNEERKSPNAATIQYIKNNTIQSNEAIN